MTAPDAFIRAPDAITCAPDQFTCAPDAEHCITCSDSASAMRLVACNTATDTGICVDAAGVHVEVLLGLINTPQIGDTLLVHAGTALLRVDSPGAESA